jgi:hypothetical protein
LLSHLLIDGDRVAVVPKGAAGELRSKKVIDGFRYERLLDREQVRARMA